MSITYSQSADYVTVNDYSEENAVGFEDLWNADIAASNGYTLLEGIIDADPDTFSLDTAVRPADSLAVVLNISCTARVGATCDISGTDAWGNALTETGIDISSGNATTTKRFASVDDNGITVTGMTNGDTFDIKQDRWGWISKNGDTYEIEGKLYIGGGTDITYFYDRLKLVYFKSQANSTIITVRNNGYFLLGSYVSDKPSDGCCLKFYSDGAYSINNITALSGSTFKAYASTFIANYYDRYIYSANGSDSEFVNCLFSGIRCVQGTYTMKNCMISNSNFAIHNTGTTENVFIDGSSNGAIIASATATYRDLVAINIGCAIYFQSTGAIISLIDCSFSSWKVAWLHSYEKTGYVNRQVSFNLHVQDRNGNGISGATVVLIDKNGTELFNGSTDASGDITEQIVTYQKYEKDGISTSTITTTYSPHTVTISKPGYKTRVVKYTMDRKREEVEKLSPDGTDITNATLYGSNIY